MIYNYLNGTHQDFIDYLYKISDNTFKNFTARLLNTRYKVIGIKVPILKQFVKNMTEEEICRYLDSCTFEYYEEILIYGLIFGKIKNIDKIIDLYYLYSQKIDSWGFTDTVISGLKIVKRHKENFLPLVEKLFLGEEFSVRSAYVFLLDYYICDEYIDYIFDKLNIRYESYYIQMAKAWLLSFIYLKYPKMVKSFLISCQDNFLVNKTISKIRDSLRVAEQDKKELLSYKR